MVPRTVQVRSRLSALPLLTVALLLSGGFVSGCGERTLETGYQYRPLSSTEVQRRAFYADPYSIEAQRAAAERRSGSGTDRRPTSLPGGGTQ